MNAEQGFWYKDWFADDRYLQLYEHRDSIEAEQLAALIERVTGNDKERKILDVACGAGRHLLAFAHRGYTNLFGQDLSPKLIAEARTITATYPIHFVVRDMRDPIESSYDLILNIFTSFGYFATDEENELVIANSAAALLLGGYFVLDYLNVESLAAGLVPAEEKILPGGERVRLRRSIENGRVVKHIRFDDETEFIESVRLYQKDEIEAMFARSGLKTTAVFGSYDGSDYHASSSPRMILFAQKQ